MRRSVILGGRGWLRRLRLLRKVSEMDRSLFGWMIIRLGSSIWMVGWMDWADMGGCVRGVLINHLA